MKIDTTSDLHLDFILGGQGKHRVARFDKIARDHMGYGKTDSEALIIAGDLGHYNKQNIEFLKHLREHYYKHIVLVHGNHDLYLVSKSQEAVYRGDSFRRLAEFADQCAKIDGVHYLDGDIVEINGVKIAGACLWYDFSYGQKRGLPLFELESWFDANSNDARAIMKPAINIPHVYRHFGKANTQIDHLAYARDQKAKLLAVVKEHNSDIIVTHIPPDDEIAERSKKTEGNRLARGSAYCTDTSEFDPYIEGKTWIFGHVHDCFDFKKRGCRFISNPFGYHRHEKHNSFIQIDTRCMGIVRPDEL